MGHLEGAGADVEMEYVNRRSGKLHGGRDKIEEYLELPQKAGFKNCISYKSEWKANEYRSILCACGYGNLVLKRLLAAQEMLAPFHFHSWQKI